MTRELHLRLRTSLERRGRWVRASSLLAAALVGAACPSAPVSTDGPDGGDAGTVVPQDSGLDGGPADAGNGPTDAGDGGGILTDAGGPGAGTTITFLRSGGRVEWSPSGDWIAYDRRSSGTCYDVFRMGTDGTGETCLTCAVAGLPTHNRGQPALDPTARYLVMQVEQQVHPNVPCGLAANPGIGVYNDLWILDLLTGTPSRVRHIPTDPNLATLHPHFSPDGGWLSWAEMYQAPMSDAGFEFGAWTLMLAPCAYAPGGGMSCDVDAGLVSLQPLGPRWYENHGFSADGTQLYFTASVPGFPAAERADEWAFDLVDGSLAALTDAGYNEHGHESPDGRHVAWMHGAANAYQTDFWLMDSDGAQKRQLTAFNGQGYPLSDGGSTHWVAADLSWSPDAGAFVGYVHSSLSWSDEERIYRIDRP